MYTIINSLLKRHYISSNNNMGKKELPKIRINLEEKYF